MIITNSIRKEGDTPADELMHLLRKQQDDESINEILSDFINGKETSFHNLPQPLLEFLIKNGRTPNWVDAELLDIGQNLYRVYGPEVNMLLLCGALPYCYSCAKGAEVLYQTGRMLVEKSGSLDPFKKRLMDTAYFVMNVLDAEGLTEEGKAIESAQKVRLIHATIRYFLNKRGSWNKEYFGEPINQQDLLGTLMAFSVVILEGLEKIGTNLSSREKEGFYHLWKLIGYYLGIKEKLLPKDYSEALSVKNQISQLQRRPSMAGIELQKTCITFMEEVIPGKAFDNIASILTRHIIGHDIADQLEVPQINKKMEWYVIKGITLAVNKFDYLADHNLFLQELAAIFNKNFTKKLISFYNNEKEINFSETTS